MAVGDAIVGPVSAMGTWSPGYEVVSGVGHLAVVKPEAADDTSLLIAKKFLLEDSLLPGGVEADYRAPLLRFNHVEPVEINRFLYGARWSRTSSASISRWRASRKKISPIKIAPASVDSRGSSSHLA